MDYTRTIEDTFYIMFTTRDFATGAPFTLASGTGVVYEDASAAEITAGVSIAADFDSKTGLNVTTIAATAANGYEVGKTYHLVLSVGTVNSVSVVGEVIGHFQLVANDVATAVDAIQAKTDSLTFTQAGHVDANIQRVNDVTVTGDGGATPWGA